MNDISLCNNCYCMTHTIKGKCGKCKEPKEETMLNDIPTCLMPDCTHRRASKGKRGANSPVKGDKYKRFSWCNYHRTGKGKAERMAFQHRREKDGR